jgi:hypothetical protein
VGTKDSEIYCDGGRECNMGLGLHHCVRIEQLHTRCNVPLEARIIHDPESPSDLKALSNKRLNADSIDHGTWKGFRSVSGSL